MMKREQSYHQSDQGYEEWDDAFGEEDKESSYPNLVYEASGGEFSPKKVNIACPLTKYVGCLYCLHDPNNREKN